MSEPRDMCSNSVQHGQRMRPSELDREENSAILVSASMIVFRPAFAPLVVFCRRRREESLIVLHKARAITQGVLGHFWRSFMSARPGGTTDWSELIAWKRSETPYVVSYNERGPSEPSHVTKTEMLTARCPHRAVLVLDMTFVLTGRFRVQRAKFAGEFSPGEGTGLQG